MFIFSVKSSKKKIVISIFIAILLIILFFVFFNKNSEQTTAISSIGEYKLSAKNNLERVDFLSQFGWQVKETPEESLKIIIPADFNKIYQDYNLIQKSQGLNLEKYKNKPCEKFTYNILNYPEDNNVQVNLLVLNGLVIGGDVSSKELNGFSHGFIKPEKSCA